MAGKQPAAWLWACAAAWMATGAHAGGIEMVTVGDPGNRANAFEPDRGAAASGAVAQAFRIGKYEVTREQYLPFLNAVDPYAANALKLYNQGVPHPHVDFSVDLSKPPGSRYGLSTGEADLPVTVSWYAAARFCNWLHNGKGGPQAAEGTDTVGAYDTRAFDDGIVANDPAAHNPGTRFWIPTEDEWIKAGHYKGGSADAGYWEYPTRANQPRIPQGAFPNTVGDNLANIRDAQATPLRKVPVGSYPATRSPYGALDMAGNLHEWTESFFEGDGSTPPKSRRMSRGGSASWTQDHLQITYRLPTHRTDPHNTLTLGFRVAATLPVSQVVELDNLDAAYTGTWPVSTYAPGYTRANYQHQAAGNGGAKATWTAAVAPGGYNVYASSVPGAQRATNAPFNVNGTPVRVNQRFNENWALLGQFTFDDTVATVTLSNDADGTVIADGVKLVPTPAGAPREVIVDNHQAVFSAGWTMSDFVKEYWGQGYAHAAPGTGSATAKWSVASLVGRYKVYASWSAGGNRARNAVYAVKHGGLSTDSLVNQQTNGGRWVLLGEYTFNGPVEVVLSNRADGYVIADAIRFLPAP